MTLIYGPSNTGGIVHGKEARNIHPVSYDFRRNDIQKNGERHPHS